MVDQTKLSRGTNFDGRKVESRVTMIMITSTSMKDFKSMTADQSHLLIPWTSTVLEHWFFPKPFSIDVATSSTVSIDDTCGKLTVYSWLEEYMGDRLGQHLSLSPSDKKDSAANLPWMDFMPSILCILDQSFNIPMFFILLRIIQEFFTWTLQEEQSIFPIPLYSFHNFTVLSQLPETSFWIGARQTQSN